jgi:hypothetical protein
MTNLQGRLYYEKNILRSAAMFGSFINEFFLNQNNYFQEDQIKN